MKKEIITSSLTGDSCVHLKHKSGLDIYICEMPGFSTVNAYISVKCGSVDTTFRTAGEKDFTTVPDGIAHFLEHKLFENEECGVFEMFAKTGAYENAFTADDRTCYLFSCTRSYQENLRILLSFIQNPYFTPENVEKEQGIIRQELQMVHDEPENRVFYNLLGGMYHSHPIKTDVGGTAESIAGIDAPLLYKCYNAFYNLNNMSLAIAGNINPDEVLAICDEVLKPCSDNGLETLLPEEPESIVIPEIYQQADIGAALFNIGYKCTPASGSELLKKSTVASLAADIITDASTEMYQSLLDKGIINSTFGAEAFTGKGYFALMFLGESPKPEKVREALVNEIERLKREGVDEKLFRRTKRACYGDFIRGLNNVNYVTGLMSNSFIRGIGTYDAIDIISAVTADDINKFIITELSSDKLVTSVMEGMAN
ncbi:MAG: insulinase family protein [Ruminococcus sp.]|nr:insulinase family protein [Ruminococcus sp.]